MSEEYKSICDKCGRYTWYEQEQPCHCSYPPSKTCDTCGHTEVMNDKDDIPCGGTLKVIDKSDLDKRFTPYYSSGERVEVVYKNGESERFYVGKLTGWKPIYLAIKKSNSSGGGAVFTCNIVSITGLGTYKPQY